MELRSAMPVRIGSTSRGEDFPPCWDDSEDTAGRFPRTCLPRGYPPAANPRPVDGTCPRVPAAEVADEDVWARF